MYDAAEKEKKNAGVKRVDENTDVLVKGSSLYRTTNPDDKIDERHKYVSVTKSDMQTYGEIYDMLPGYDWNKPVADLEYEAKKDIKIANGKAVVDYVVNKYGDKKVSDAVKELRKLPKSSLYEDNFFEDHDKKTVSDFIKNTLEDKKLSSDIFKYYRKKGYDAIVDPEDQAETSNFGAQYPLILLTPYDSIFEKSRKVYQ